MDELQETFRLCNVVHILYLLPVKVPRGPEGFRKRGGNTYRYYQELTEQEEAVLFTIIPKRKALQGAGDSTFLSSSAEQAHLRSAELSELI